MAGKEVQPNQRRKRLAAIGIAVIVLGSCITIRCLKSAPLAGAQSVDTRQRRSARPPKKAKAVPRGNRSTAMRSAATAPPADVVAMVNGQPIKHDYLARECIRRFGEDVLESEVNKRLILAACAERGITVTRQEVEAEVSRMARKFDVPKGQWLAMLEDERGITPTQYRRDIVWPTLALKRIAAKSLQVTDEELERAFESEYGPTVQVRMIATKSKAKAQKLAAAAKKQPTRFGELAKKHSEDVNSAAARGLIPPIRRYVGDPEVESAAFALQDGEVSSVIPVSGQYILLRCDRHIPAREIPPKQREVIAEALKDRIAESKLRSEGKEIFAKLQERAKVVNVLNDPQLRKKMPGIAAMVNGKPITLKQLGQQCIMRNGMELLESEINRRVLEQALKRRSLEVSKSDLNAEIARAAESFGFFTPAGKPDVTAWLKKVTEESGVTVDLYVRDAVWPTVALKKLVDSQVTITQDDMEKGFAANFGERVEVLAVVLSDQRTAHEVFDLARKNPTEKFFGKLASQYSVEPVSKANFGQVPPIRQHGGQQALEREAFRLKPGQMSGVVAVSDKYIILRCLGRTKPVVDEKKVVEKELQRDIREKKLRIAMARTFEKLKQSARIKNYLAESLPARSRQAGRQVSYQQEPPQSVPRPKAK
jgi:parvulin-like peptidyl-prolyl isomerase